MSENKKVWFVSDHHFGHELMRKMRNFETIEEHDQTIIDAHNRVVNKGDDVYFLGDFVFKSKRHWEYYTQQLNGNLHLIRGNHDVIGLEGKTKGFAWVKDYYELKLPNLLSPTWKSDKAISFVLFHYPMYAWHWNNRGSIHLHGHTHLNLVTSETIRGKTTDVCVNPRKNWEPYELRDILLMMQEREIFAPDCVNY